jgi:hypothetical protein
MAVASHGTFLLVRFACCSTLGAAILCAALLWPRAAEAQVNLPPPPPPPLSTESPPPTQSNPPPQRRPRPTGSGSGGREATHETREPQRERLSTDDWSPPRSYGRDWSIRLNPLTFFVARVSVDIEWLVAPHHALVLSPHLTFPQGQRGSLPMHALGFAGTRAHGFGLEFGYRYYPTGYSEPEGIFFGPSLLLDSTQPTPDADRFLAYGGAFDVGYQVIIGNGFTMSAGGGLLLIASKDQSSQVAPRALFSVGWSF